MGDVTIVSDDAERLVREGGVINRDGREPDPFDTGIEPFTVEVMVRDWEPMHEWDTPSDRHVGTVRVVDVHHGSDCFEPDTEAIRELAGVRKEDADRLGYFEHCHPDAEPGEWHLTVEPIDQGDDNG